MKTKRYQILTILLLGLALLGAGCQNKTNTNTNTNININNSLSNNNINGNSFINDVNSGSLLNSSTDNTNQTAQQQQQQISKIMSQTEVEKIAKFFTEYFGSFSTDSNFNNIIGMKSYMSASMIKWADNFVTITKATQKNNTEYLGVTTKAVSAKTNSFSDETSKADIVVSTQRREITGTSTTARIYYQDLSLKFVKENNTWKVNEAVWK